MIFRDTSGAVLDKGTKVVFSLGLGNVAFGSIIETHTLGINQTQPVLVIQLAVVVPADASGFVAGVAKIPDSAALPVPRIVE